MSDEPAFLSIPEVQRALGFSRTRVYELVKDGAIKSVPLGARRRLVPRSEVERVTEELLRKVQ